ncbi:MAG: beta,2-mannobiose phosphorylase / 1,2-beta-oligomannan phosphorylase, partial [Patescibacteria group bacterium]|nr:beta,2-mannobiose phosphorylase / 1,2-beta-oligomannan phosphorylase [Patescibacteria group bacterium]
MALKKSSKKKVVKKIKKLTKKKITKKVMKPKVVRRSVKKVNKPKKILKVKKTKKSKKIVKTIKRPTKKILTKKKTLKPKKKVLKKVKQKEVKLERAWHNPIITPRAYPWESKATFNPAAFLHDDKVYIMYRAIGEDDMSVLGYAVSNDGKRINERPTHFAYRRYMAVSDFAVPIFYDSGGGWAGGCEDPRLTLIGDTLYLLYTAFDGWGSVRIAM